MRRLLKHRFLAPSLMVMLAAVTSVACSGTSNDAAPSDDGALPGDEVGGAGGSSASKGDSSAGKGGSVGKGGSKDVAESGGANGDGDTDSGAGDPALNEGEYSLGAFEYADPQPAGFNPLGKERFNLLRLEETAFVLNGGDGGFTLDDAQHGLTRASLGAALAPQNEQAVWAGSGNLDEDGNAELVVLSRGQSSLTVTVGDNDGDQPLAKTRTFSVAHGGAEAGALKAALGDFDGDGKDEIALAVTAGQTGWVRIYDDASAGFDLLKELSSSSSGQGDVDLAAGNFDGDESSELAVLRIGSGTNDVKVTLFDDSAASFAQLSEIPATSLLPATGQGNEYSRWLSGGLVRTGNVDGDAKDELYVLLTHQDIDPKGNGARITQSRLFDEAGTTPTLLASPGGLNDLQYPQRSLERPVDAAFADLDGDGVDELYWLHLGSHENTFAWYLSQWRPKANGSAWNGNYSYRKLDSDYNPVAFGRLAVIAGDELAGETLVVALKNNGSPQPMRTLRILGEASVQADDEHQSFALAIPTPQPTTVSYPSASVPLVAGGDFDNDNLQVKYTGNKWQSLASPRPIAVLATPPQNAGMSQSEASSGTAYGKEALRGAASTDELGASYGTTLSFDSSGIADAVGLGGLGGGSISQTLERAFSSSKTSTTLQTTGTSYASAYPDDCIVFQGVLHTSYEYEVTTASDPSLVGHKLTIDVPVAVKTYKWTLDFYNSKVGDDGVEIGSETLSHVAGDPASYPTASDRDKLLAQYSGWKSTQEAVGQGSGTNKVSISLANEVTNTSTNTITNDDSWGVAVAGFGYSESRAATTTWVYEVTVGDATNYEGIVGDIKDNADYRDFSYDFGLFVYQYQHPKGPRFQVVNYWTSNLGPGFE